MTSPASLAGALVLACAAVWIAGILLWRRQRPIFWFAAALTLVAVGYLVATGATEDIGRGLLPGLFDPTQRRELEAIAVRGHEKSLGLWLIGMPIGLILIYKYWKRKSALIFASFVLGTCMLLLAMTRIPDGLARLVLPEEILKRPSQQR